MSSSHSSSGYNNAAYSNQYDYDQLARQTPSTLVNSGNITYITSAVDNCCYEGDEEIQLSSVIARQQRRQLIREPPIGASTTFRFTESRVEHPQRIPTSPKRYRHDCTQASPGNIQETIISPRTPKKNIQTITPTSTPRKQNGNLPRRSHSFTSPRKPPISSRVPMPLSPGPVPRQKMMQATSTRIPPSYNVKCVPPQQQIVTSPQRNTAVIPPMYSTQHVPITPDVLSATKKKLFVASGVSNTKPHIKMDISPGLRASWIHIPTPYQSPPTATIVMAAIFLLFCGAASAVLCLYMMSKDGRLYYLDFGVLSGFGSALLGCLGFRSRRWQWLPNRNYVSGYVVLSMFSVLSCAGLVTILTLRPKPGEPLADVAGGAVCGIAALSLILTAFGVISSRCCKYPPPDNRVEHCALGFTL